MAADDSPPVSPPPVFRETFAALGIGCAGALLVWCSLPPAVIAFNDDFGYLRSVVETVQRGRPWTSDWLEPWTASLSLLCALVYGLTEHFRFAVYGVQAACVGIVMTAFFHLLRHRGLPIAAAALWTCAASFTPTLLWKFSEFGAIPLYVACLLVALRAAERDRWPVFLVAWLVALSSRQSALVWLALPAALAVERAIERRLTATRAAAMIGLLGATGAAAYFALQAGMNRTHAQAAMMPDLFANLGSTSFAQHAAIGIAVFLTGAGVGGFVLRSVGNQARSADPASARPVIVPLLAAAGVAIVWWIDLRSSIQFEHGLWHEGVGAVLFHLLSALAVAGWIWSRVRVSLAHLLAAAVMAALIGLRGVAWDYYFVDLAILGFLAARPGAGAQISGTPARWPMLAGYATAAGVVLLNISAAREVQRQLDHNYAAVVLCERALRAGTIEPSELLVAPFGFQGWHLYPHYIAAKGAAGGYIADFVKYLRPQALRFDVIDANGAPPAVANGRLLAGEEIVDSEVFPWGYSRAVRYTLIRRALTLEPERRIDRSRYRQEKFPLDDEEWRELIAGAPR